MTGAPLAHVRPASTEDLAQVAAISADLYPSLGTRDDAVRRFSWKYGDNPEGFRGAILEDEDGSIAAFVGGVPARAVLEGAPISILQSSDHLVAPSHRNGLRRLGNFARTMRWWCTHYCSPHAHRIGYGFPSAEDARIGVRIARYELLRPVNVVFNDRPAGLRDHGSAEFECGVESTPPADSDALWRQNSPQHGLCVIRDHRYLDWRYARHPDFDYSFITARDGSAKSAGIAVVRVGGLATDVLTIVDWITPSNEPAVTRVLLGAIGRFATERGLAGICAWFVETSREFAAFQDQGFRVRPTRLALVGRSFDRSIRVDALRHGFKATLGDTDFL